MAFGPRALLIVPAGLLLLWGGVIAEEVYAEKRRAAAWAALLEVYETRGREAARVDIAAGRPQPVRERSFSDPLPGFRVDPDTGLPFKVLVEPGFGCRSGEAEASAERQAYRDEIEVAYAAGGLDDVSFLDRLDSLDGLADLDAGSDWPTIDPCGADAALSQRDGTMLRWEPYGSSGDDARVRLAERVIGAARPTTWVGPVLQLPLRAKRVDDGRTLLVHDGEGHRWGFDTETGVVLALFPAGDARFSRW